MINYGGTIPDYKVDILVKWPTFKRRQWFMRTFDLWMQWASKSKNIKIHFLITMQDNDSESNCIQMKNFLDKKNNQNQNITISWYYGVYRSKIAAINAQMNNAPDFNIVIVGSDDMQPQISNWDKHIINSVSLVFPGFSAGLLHTSDGIANQRCCTLTIMTKNLYNYYGYLYYPKYLSVFCDNQLTQTAQKIFINNKKCYTYLKKCIFRHKWQGNTKKDDVVYKKNQKDWNHDKKVYQYRKKLGFPRLSDN